MIHYCVYSYPLVEGDNTHTNSACDKFEEQEYATVDDIKNQRIPVSESQYDKLSKKAESDTEVSKKIMYIKFIQCT